MMKNNPNMQSGNEPITEQNAYSFYEQNLNEPIIINGNRTIMSLLILTLQFANSTDSADDFHLEIKLIDDSIIKTLNTHLCNTDLHYKSQSRITDHIDTYSIEFHLNGIRSTSFSNIYSITIKN